MTLIQDEYFRWMYDLVCDGDYYTELLRQLNETPFRCTMPRDENRAADGIELRYRFGYENGYSRSTIARFLDVAPCSVLEMMVALAFYCEEHIMGDEEQGNRTKLWFEDMIGSLGLSDMDDDHYDERLVASVLYMFLERAYGHDGNGGLFYIPNCEHDMRTAEIWYQFCWYLDYKIKEGDT